MLISIVSDIHMSGKNLQEKAANWRMAVNDMDNLDCEILIVCGDLFDNPNLIGIKSAVVGDVYSAFKEPLLDTKNLRLVYLIPGNHDMGHGGSENALYPLNGRYFNKMGKVVEIHVINEPMNLKFNSFNAWFLPWGAKRSPEETNRFLQYIDSGFMFAHLEINGANMGNQQLSIGGDFSFSQVQLQQIPISLGFLGHVHLSQKIGKYQYTGCLFHNSYKDEGSSQGFWILDLNDDGVTWEHQFIDMSSKFPSYYTVNAAEYMKRKGTFKPNDHIKIRDSELPHEEDSFLPIELPTNIIFESVPKEKEVQLRAAMNIDDSPFALFETYSEVNGIEYDKAIAEKILSEAISRCNLEASSLGSLERINRFSIDGMHSYREKQEIEFPDGIIGFVGANGHGKSAAVEVPMAVLYGNYPSKTSIGNQVNTKRADAEIEMEWVSKGEAFVGTRRVFKDSKPQKAQLREKGKKDLICNKVREYESFVSQLVGDEKLFLSSCFMSQNKAASFLLADPRDRKDVLSKLLGFNNLEQIFKELKRSYDQQFGELTVWKKEHAELTFTDPAQIEKEILDIKSEISKIKESIKASTDSLAEERDKLPGIIANIASFNERLKIQQEAAARISEVNRLIAETSERIKNYEVRIPDMKDEKEMLQEALKDIRDEMEEVIKRIDEEREKLKSQITIREAAIASLNIDTSSGMAISEDITRLERVISKLDNDMNNERLIRENERSNLQKDLHKLIQGSKLLEKGIGCSPNFLDCSLIKAAVEQKAQIPQLEERIGDLEIEILEEKFNEILKRSRDDAQQKLGEQKANQSEANAKMQGYFAEQAALNTLNEEYNKINSSRYQENCLQDNKRKEGELSQKIANLERDINVAETSLTHDKEALAQYDDELKRAGGNTQYDVRNEIDKLESQKSAIDSKIYLITQELQDSNGKEAQLNLRLGAANQDLEYNTNLKNKKDELAEKIKKLQGEETSYSLLVRAFDKNGIPQLLIDSCIPHIRKILKELLSDFDDVFNIRIETQKMSEAGDKVSEVLNIIVSDSEGERDVKDYSGGERGIIDLVFRIAFAKLQSERNGSKILVFFADEPFDALDSENAPRVLQVLQKLIQSGLRQVFIVSHSEDIIHGLPHLYMFEKVNGTTKIAKVR